MRKDKEKARHLRLSGKSYSDIYKILKIPRSTLSNWFSKEDWSQRIHARLAEDSKNTSSIRIRELNKIRGENLIRVYEEARREARSEFEELKYNPLFIAGLMLYWGEGNKVSRGKVGFVNTEVEMIRLYLNFLRKVCKIPLSKIRLQLLVYPDLNEPALKLLWFSKTGIPIRSFIKSTFIEGRHKTKKLGTGVCIVYVCNTYFKTKILEWLELLPKALMDRRYYENI